MIFRMKLNELRGEINEIDVKLMELFEKRMEVCINVAQYKIDNKLPVFQTEREHEIIKKVREGSPKWLENGSEVLFTTIMDISKSLQFQRLFSDKKEIKYTAFSTKNDTAPTIACPGTKGSYSQIAASTIFPNSKAVFFEDFEDVIKSVVDGKYKYGILPIQNSTAGSVHQSYNLLKEYDCHIATSVKVKISHCIAVKNETDIKDVKKILSHEQALAQCSDYIKRNGFKPVEHTNTALAAEFVKDSELPLAAICSVECANRLGLKIIAECITNVSDNYTRFILLSKEILCSENANIISVSLSLSHSRSALYRLLTKFSVAGLNLLRIENKPIANKDFDVVFYLDFEGSISNPEVAMLISELQSELSYFKFLGNYYEIQ